MALIGFSQGTMMSLHVGLRRQRPLAGILGYSGMLVDGELLKKEITTKPPVRLIHGDADDILPVQALPEAVEGLEGAGVAVESFIRPGLGHGIDEECIRLGQAFLADIFAVASK
jgi:phospholipase/carboxylesterase